MACGPPVSAVAQWYSAWLETLSKNINPSLVLVQPRKTHPCLTERLLIGRKDSNQTNKQTKSDQSLHSELIGQIPTADSKESDAQSDLDICLTHILFGCNWQSSNY